MTARREGLEWLQVPLTCEGRLIRPALSLDALSDADLPDICLRMGLILGTIENRCADGRWINMDIFGPIDDMESDLRHRQGNTLDQWYDAIANFAHYYRGWLDGKTAFEIERSELEDDRYIADHHGISLGDSP